MHNIPSELIITVESYIYITSFKMKGSPDLGQAVYSKAMQTQLYFTWVDQKVLKILAYLFRYTTELYETFTEYSATIV